MGEGAGQGETASFQTGSSWVIIKRVSGIPASTQGNLELRLLWAGRGCCASYWHEDRGPGSRPGGLRVQLRGELWRVEGKPCPRPSRGALTLSLQNGLPGQGDVAFIAGDIILVQALGFRSWREWGPTDCLPVVTRGLAFHRRCLAA